MATDILEVQNQMEELVKFVATYLVDDPSQVAAKSRSNPSAITVELSVAEGDMGKVIGKNGRIAKAIRKVVNAAAMKANINCIVEII